MKTLCVPCFVFGPVVLLFFGACHFVPFLAVQASYLEMGTGFCILKLHFAFMCACICLTGFCYSCL